MSADANGAPEKIVINVDGKPIEAHPGEMVIAAAERGGIYIPRFCWHPRMKPVGMCRMCLVEIKGPRGFALMPACYVPVADGQEVVTDSAKVKKAQDGVLEFLLINHPLDCPVCDRGGECPLQDQTFAFGPGESRFVEEKRHWEKPIPINPLVALDRERCIQCARCTRFAAEVAGDAMIDFISRSDQTEINIFPGQPFESNFSGNIVQICPVGALTAIPYRFRARPWDLDVVESTCTFCAVGCRMALQSSSNRVVRHLAIDSDPVNHGWLCDKGRFGYEAANHPDRIVNPLVRKGEELVEVSWPEALEAAAAGLQRIKEVPGPQALAVLGGARLPNEDAYAWAKLARAVLGTDNVDCQMGDGLPAEVVLGLPRATIDEACRAQVVVLLGPDLKEELPVLYLRLREAAVEGQVKLIEISPQATSLTSHVAVALTHRPGEAAAVVRAIAGRRQSAKKRISADNAGGVSPNDISAAAELLAGGDVVVVLGRPSVAESAASTVDAAGVLASTLPGVRFMPALRRGNVHGALDMGLAPGVLPGRVALDDGRDWYRQAWESVPARPGLDAQGILRAAAESQVQGLVLVGADPVADFPDRALVRKALDGVAFTLAVDLFFTESVRHADVVLPACAYGERAGTTTNLEGRVTRLGPKVTAPGTCRPDWMIAAELALTLGSDLGFATIDEIAAEIESLAPSHAGLTPNLLARGGYRDGLVVPLDSPELPPPGSRAPGEAGAGEQPAAPPPPAPRAVEAIEVDATHAHMGTAQVESEPDADSPLAPLAGTRLGPSGKGPRPPLLAFSPGAATPPSPPVDAYSLRLVSARRLYDRGALVEHSPALAQLVKPLEVAVNPYDLGRLGVTTGDRVRLTSARGSLVVEAVADEQVPRGSAVLPYNQTASTGTGAGDLIDASLPVTDVRIETVGAGGTAA